MGIFKAYDIRGIYPDEINEDIIYKIGRAFADFLRPKNVLVARDMRESSPKLYNALTKGLTEQGADVTYAGMVDTPMFYFCARNYEAAVMVTASHNPRMYNGLKFCAANVKPITYDNGLKKVEEMVKKGNFQGQKRQGIRKNGARQKDNDWERKV